MISQMFPVSDEKGRESAYQYVEKAFDGAREGDRVKWMQLSLLTEETLGMVGRMTEGFSGIMWFANDGDRWEIHLDVKARITGEKRHDLLSLSTFGRNAATRGFMDMVGDFIADVAYSFGHPAAMPGGLPAAHGMLPAEMVSVSDITPMWTLSQYRADIKRDHSPVELSELEKSIVASLSDDIVVGVRGNAVALVVIKDFSYEKPVSWFATDPVSITEAAASRGIAKAISDRFARRAKLSGREHMRLTLLVEETLGMMDAMTDAFMGKIWIEGDGGQCLIHVDVSARIDRAGEERLVSAATSGKNAAPIGFMSRLGRMIRNAFADDDGIALTGSLFEEEPEFMAYRFAGRPSVADRIPTWSLSALKESLHSVPAGSQAAADAADELEKSIVAKLADDVTVSVRGENVSLVITRSFSNTTA